MSVQALIVAAGRGSRSGIGYNKVYHPLGGCCVLSHSIRRMAESGLFDGIFVVISREDEALFQETLSRDGTRALVSGVAYGGDTRQQSVYNGLCALPPDAELVAIHDGARPYVTQDVMRATLDSARAYGSGVISTPVIDTIKQVDGEGFAVATPPRERLRAVQTPQTFRYAEILAAHRQALAQDYVSTDDAALYEHVYGRVRLVQAQGAEQNKKLTLPEDFQVAPALRVGTGYDVHRLVEGRKLILCGVDVPYERGLLGHSDADVALHALMDALLGAAALGDIGRHFPDTDEHYRGISSMKLLREVARLLAEKGFAAANVDVTIVAQRPKLKDYIPQMNRNVAEALNLSEDCVNVKATTTEKLGFEGEGLGISAQSVAMIRRI